MPIYTATLQEMVSLTNCVYGQIYLHIAFDKLCTDNLV